MVMQYELDQARAISEIAMQLRKQNENLEKQNKLIEGLTAEVRALQTQLRERQ